MRIMVKGKVRMREVKWHAKEENIKEVKRK